MFHLSLTKISVWFWLFVSWRFSGCSAFAPLYTSQRSTTVVGYRSWRLMPSRSNYKLFNLPITRNEFIIAFSSTCNPTEEGEIISDDDRNNKNVNSDAIRWRAEAARIRLEAEKMEVSLILEKIKAMEDKLNNPNWVTKHSLADVETMEQQLEQVRRKIYPDNSEKNDNNSKESSKTLDIKENKEKIKNVSFFNVNRFLNNNIITKEDASTQEKAQVTTTSVNSITQLLQVSPKPPIAKPRSPTQQQLSTLDNTKKNTLTGIEIPGASITKDLHNDNSIFIRLDPSTFDESKNDDKRRIERMEEKRDITGYDPKDLELYLPIAQAIEQNMVNATANEKLDAFRSTPELQQHFQMKIASLLIQPLKDMQELEQLKKQYLTSSSRIEKQSLRRRIDKLQEFMTNSESINEQSMYSDTIHLKDLKPLSDKDMNMRIQALTSLPNVLQTLYKKRFNLEYNDTIELAIELDYYENQLQLLDQVKYIKKSLAPEEEKGINDDIMLAIESLPIRLRKFIGEQSFGLNPVNMTVDDLFQAYSKYRELGYDDDDDDEDDDDNEDTIDVIDLIREGARQSASMFDKKKLEKKGTATTSKSIGSLFKKGLTLQTVKFRRKKDIELDLPEYDDIDFIDRSRYLEEFYPAIARMEGQHPSEEVINDFYQNIIEKKVFMVSNKPERVVGGWYIRGRNLLANEYDTNNNEASSRLVESLQRSINKSKYKDSLQFFYIPDPSPLTDEDFEMDYASEPILVITSKNDPKTFYNYSGTITKTIISMFGLFSILLVAVGATVLQPDVQLQIEGLKNNADIALDLSFGDTVTQITLSMLSIHLSHELGHCIIAWKDKFRLGVPTFIPSVQLGLMGAITAFTTPPPNIKSLFDFGIAGPLVGLLVSIGYLLGGLYITSHMNIDQLSGLPVWPSELLRSSELEGGLVEYFLGKGTVTQSGIDTLIPLHPYAIAGSVGIIANALALLPLGHTDGGRIAVAMFGRRGAYIVKAFTTVILCAIGLFGFDTSSVLLIYIFFAQVWQRELETPATNEVDELDFPRGALGIVTALVVALSLIPMLS